MILPHVNKSVTKRQLFCGLGGKFPRVGLRNVLGYYELADLAEVKAKVKSGDLTLAAILKIKGNGTASLPGLLPCYLFKLKPVRYIRIR